jgi:glucoamylase
MQKTLGVATALLSLAGASGEKSQDGASCYLQGSALSEPFSAAEVSTMRGFFLDNLNIDGKGGVVAAPDTDTPGGSYYYHWMRDAALSMRTLQETGNLTETDGYMQAYTQWVLNTQTQSSPNGIDIRTEPKFNLPYGDVVSSSWCRPQNDGPGLRASALMMYADTLLGSGRGDYVTEYLWTGDGSDRNGGAIKFDLDYVIDGWYTSTCDLWEEYTNADLFWNRFTMKRAMLQGAAFASARGDAESMSRYTDTANKIDADLYNSHWTGSYVQEASGRTKDAAVIVGFNAGFAGPEGDSLFAPTSFEVASTVNAYNQMFCSEYSINTADTSNGLPGVLYGRYENDNYAGGNPWQLLTAALANLFYRGASYVLDEGVPDATALGMWETALNLAAGSLADMSKAQVAEQFAIAGDSVMLRLREHVDSDGWHLFEQMDRGSGQQMSAENLTWSYAEVLNAMRARGLYVDKK